MYKNDEEFAATVAPQSPPHLNLDDVAWDEFAEYVTNLNTPLAIFLEQQVNELCEEIFLPPYHEWRTPYIPVFTPAARTHHFFAPPDDSNLSDPDSAITIPSTDTVEQADETALTEPLGEVQLAQSSNITSNDKAYSEIQHLI